MLYTHLLLYTPSKDINHTCSLPLRWLSPCQNDIGNSLWHTNARSNSFPISCLLSLPCCWHQICFWTDKCRNDNFTFYNISLSKCVWHSVTLHDMSRVTVAEVESSSRTEIKLTSNFLLYSIKSQGNVLLCREIQQVKSLWKKKILSQTVKKVFAIHAAELFRKQVAIRKFNLLPDHLSVEMVSQLRYTT